MISSFLWWLLQHGKMGKKRVFVKANASCLVGGLKKMIGPHIHNLPKPAIHDVCHENGAELCLFLRQLDYSSIWHFDFLKSSLNSVGFLYLRGSRHELPSFCQLMMSWCLFSYFYIVQALHFLVEIINAAIPYFFFLYLMLIVNCCLFNLYSRRFAVLRK